jgi:hypothetical protein
MDVARDVIELFSVKDPARARELAAKLDQLNTSRQEEERRILRSLEDRISGDPALCDAYCIVLDGEGWHRGVIGITATRVVERYNRPTLVISREGEEAFGSGRSIRAFHLLEAVESCRDLFSRYGGHAHACGFAMPAANIEALRARLDAFARARLTLADFEPVLDVDGELPFDEITPELFQSLRLLEPYGVGNPEPVFSARGTKLTAPPRILKDKHLKLKLTSGVDSARVGTGAPPVPAAPAAGLGVESTGEASEELSEAAILVSPRCHPDTATIPRRDVRSAAENRNEAAKSSATWRRSIVFDALAWNMAERLQQSPLLAGDAIDIAFTIGHNDHPEYGGLELSLRDFKREMKAFEQTASQSKAETKASTAHASPHPA